MKKKWILMLLLILSMTLLFAACKGEENEQEQGDGQEPTKTQEDGQNSNQVGDTGTSTGYKSGDVTLGQYRGLEVEAVKVEITDGIVFGEILNDLQSLAEETDRTTVERYDVVNLDYEGMLDGVAFAGGTATGQTLIIGSESFIDGFEEGLIGVSVGEKVELPLSFPENYSNKEMAGKAVVFLVTVNSLKAMPEITDELVKANSEYETLEAYKTALRAELEQTVASNIASQKQADLLNQIIETSTFNRDLTAEIEEYGKQLKSYYTSMAQYYTMDFTTLIYYMTGLTEAQFDEQLPLASELAIKRELVLNAIVEAENMSLSDAEYNDEMEQMLRDTTNFETAAEIEEYYGKEALQNSFLLDRAVELVMDTAIEK